MDDDERKEDCLEYLRSIKGKGKSPAGFEEALLPLQDEASTRGLESSDIKLIIETIEGHELRSGLCVLLVKCLIPKKKIPNKSVEQLIQFWLSKCDELPVTVSITILQWLVGLWDYQLVDRQSINIFYDCFFFNLLKKEKLESHIARLVYMLTKPEDVTRRQVFRLLRLQEQYSKPQKHISALLSLFKSYKPELVPEKISSLNIESVWKPIPEVFTRGFEDARRRNALGDNRGNKSFDWNVLKSHQKGKKMSAPLVPSIRYFHMGSSIYKDRGTKSLFDVNNVDDIGKHYFDVELPTNATSLLANTAGYLFLTFSNFEYQSRFSHNLYNTLRRAFIVEPGKFSNSQKEQLLDMTTEFSRYIQQSIPVVVRFLHEYLPYETGTYRSRLLPLMALSTSVSASDFEFSVAPYLESMFLEGSLEEKCSIIDSLRKLMTNLFVNQNFGRETPLRPSVFLGQVPTSELCDLVPIVLKVVDNLMTQGLNIHANDSLLLSESLSFYEMFNHLVKRCEIPLLHLAPAAVIYSGFATKSSAILSRTCGLLLRYLEIIDEVEKSGLRDNYIGEIENWYIYANDFRNTFWYDKAFADRDRGRFLPNMPDEVIDSLPKNAPIFLNIQNHMALLPHICTLEKTGLIINTKKIALKVAENYYPKVSDFLYACSISEKD